MWTPRHTHWYIDLLIQYIGFRLGLMVHSDGDAALNSLHRTLGRLQDELLEVGRHKRADVQILRDIDTIEALIEHHEREDEHEGAEE